MPKQLISTGTTPNDETGDTLFQGAIKVNSNFNDIYNAYGDGTNLYSIFGSNGGLEVNLDLSAPPTNVKDMSFELVNNTTLRINVRGTDEVVRSVDLTLS